LKSKIALKTTKYATPPIFEVGFSIRTGSAGMVDPYDVRSLHELYRAELPQVQRQLPIGPGGDGSMIQITSPDDDHQRWWFVSEDNHTLAQFQTNFVGRNWRREALPPGQGAAYPGYTRLATDFRDQVARLEAHLLASGREMPKPVSADMFFDNMIPFGPGIRLRDIVQPIQFDPPFQIVGFNCSWKEGLVADLPTDDSFLQVEMRSVGAGLKDEPIRSFLRLRFVARHIVESVDSAMAFFDEAHTLVHRRLLELTTPECRTTWGKL